MSQATLHRACIIGGVIFSGYTAPCMFVVNHEDGTLSCFILQPDAKHILK